MSTSTSTSTSTTKDGDVADKNMNMTGKRQHLVDDDRLQPPSSDEPTDGQVDLDDATVQDVESLMAERDSYQDQFQRARADYQNLRRRVEQDRATARQQAAQDILLHLLPVVDDFERALRNAPAAEDQQSWISGTRMVGKKLLGLLERYGVQRFASLGQPFDPKHHEAVATDGDGSYVVEVYQDGYQQGDQVLRPAMVRTGSNPPPAEQADEAGEPVA